MTSFADPGNQAQVRNADVRLGADTSPYQQQMASANRTTAILAGTVATLSDRVDNLFKMAGRSLKIVAAADVAAIGAGVANVAALQKEMGTLSATAAVNRTSVGNYGRAIDNAFGKFPVHRGNIVALVNTLSNLGVGAKDIDSVTQAAVKLEAATGESGLAGTVVQLDRQMGQSASTFGRYANSILTVSKNAGVSASSVTQFGQAIAPIARQANISEAAVIGISTAFSKAGADGYLAANTFNTILNDITTLARTGSPELAKYSSFVGQTVDQFRRLPAKEQITEIFDAIAKGGPKALDFLSSLGLGTRQLTAVQAVAQGGGLQHFIRNAESASRNQDNLNKGSGAAFGGLSNAATSLHNQFTRLGDLISGPLLTPLTLITKGFAAFLHGINNVVEGLGPLRYVLSALSVVAAPLLLAGGAALTHSGLTAAYLGARYVARRGRSASGAFGQGRAAGAATAEGLTAEEAMGSTTLGAALLAGNRVPLRDRMGFRAGRYVGGIAGAEEETAVAGRSRGLLAATLLPMARWLGRGMVSTARAGVSMVGDTGRFLGRRLMGRVRGATGDAGAAIGPSAAELRQLQTAEEQVGAQAGLMANETSAAMRRQAGAVEESTAQQIGALDRLAAAQRRASGLGFGARAGRAFGILAAGQIVGGMIDNGQKGTVRNRIGTTVTDAAAGAALGTLVMPGIGTAVGAGIGGLLGFVNSGGPTPAEQARLRQMQYITGRKLGIFGPVGRQDRTLQGDTAAGVARLVTRTGSPSSSVTREAALALARGQGLTTRAHAAGLSAGDLESAITGTPEDLNRVIRKWAAQGKPSETTLQKLRALQRGFSQGVDNARITPQYLANARNLLTQSPLAHFMSTSSLVAAATTTRESDPASVNNAMRALGQRAVQTSGGMTAASAQLLKLAGAMGGAQTASGRLLIAASAWVRQLQDTRMPLLSPRQQLGTLNSRVAADVKAGALQPGADDSLVKQYQADVLAAQQAGVSLQQTQEQTGIQLIRAQEDYQTQRSRSVRDFYRQMTYAEQDYETQTKRAQQDFYIQQARAAQSAAEQIYNPFQRVQSQSVMNGGMLAGNLADQNQRIQQQLRQLRQLRAAGLSQSAIDTLRLSDPSNAQQVNSLARSVVNDPATVRRINEEISTRRHATVSLTQSNFNEDFRNTVADFSRQLSRAGDDYQRAHDRAVESQRTALSDMSTDYNRMVERTAMDLELSMTQIYAHYGTTYIQTLQNINKQIGKYAPQLAQTLTAEVAAAKNAINNAANTGNTNSSPSPGAGTKGNPITAANTTGRNQYGAIGYYDAHGKWHTVDTRSMSAEQRKALPYVGPPSRGDANTPDGAKAYAKSQLANYGWSQSQFAPLESLWTEESGWRYTARNKSSGALGIPQALGHTLPAGYANNGRVQVDWGLSYIKGRYGTPAAAWAFERSHTPNWYGTGGVFTGPKHIGIGEAGPEAVVPLTGPRGQEWMTGMYASVAKAVAQQVLVSGRGIPGMGAGGGSYSYSYDQRTEYSGEIRVEARDPAAFERQLAARARLKRLANPAHR